jgi:uncharacterized BrkB/YihY/UPF0761 family membrane protein
MWRFLRLLRISLWRAVEHDAFAVAKAAAYSSILTLFPALLVLGAVLATFHRGEAYLSEISRAVGKILPASILATWAWFVATAIFGWYLRHYADYSIIYGSLGAAIALLVWMYIISVIVLVGAEFNALLYPRLLMEKNVAAESRNHVTA